MFYPNSIILFPLSEIKKQLELQMNMNNSPNCLTKISGGGRNIKDQNIKGSEQQTFFFKTIRTMKVKKITTLKV